MIVHCFIGIIIILKCQRLVTANSVITKMIKAIGKLTATAIQYTCR